VNLHFIDPGIPVQNAFIVSFKGKLRDECLNQHWFVSLDEARRIMKLWRMDYNPAPQLPWAYDAGGIQVEL
jgi:putative transposase